MVVSFCQSRESKVEQKTGGLGSQLKKYLLHSCTGALSETGRADRMLWVPMPLWLTNLLTHTLQHHK